MSRSTYNGIVTITVGSEKVEFMVHQDLICDRSPFFKAAYSGEWAEAQRKKVDLPDHEADSFKIYLEWAYSLRKDLADLARAAIELEVSEYPADEKTNARRDWLCIMLCSLWMLGDCLGDDEFKNDVMTSLIGEHSRKDRALQMFYSPFSRRLGRGQNYRSGWQMRFSQYLWNRTNSRSTSISGRQG